jgi:hypothetical protein
VIKLRRIRNVRFRQLLGFCVVGDEALGIREKVGGVVVEEEEEVPSSSSFKRIGCEECVGVFALYFCEASVS